MKHSIDINITLITFLQSSIKFQISMEQKQCVVQSVSAGDCGKGVKGNSDLVTVSSLNRDVEGYYKKLGLMSNSTGDVPLMAMSERSLIENRLGLKLNHDDYICAKHRDRQGVYWHTNSRCPFSVPSKKCSSNLRILPMDLLETAKLVIGMKTCETHRKRLLGMFPFEDIS